MFFSEKFPPYGLIHMGSVDANINPDFGSHGFDDVDIRPMEWSDAAQGRFAIFLSLTRDEHFLLDLRRESRLAGDFGYVVPDQVMTSGVEAFIAKTSMSTEFRGHFRGNLRVHFRVHFRERFRERLRGSNFAVRVLCAFLHKS